MGSIQRRLLAVALILLASATVPTGAADPVGDPHELDQRRFTANVTSTGLGPSIDHELVPSGHADLFPPDRTDRIVLTVGWAEEDRDGTLRVEVLGEGCLTACQQAPIATAEGPTPIELSFSPSPEATDELHVHVTSDEDARAAEPVEGTARFLATPERDRSSLDAHARDELAAPPSEPGAWRETTLTVGTVAGLAAAVWWALSRTGWVAPITGLFSRLEKDELLEHPVRRRIVEAIDEAPCIHLEALVRRLDLGRGQLEHHVGKLLAADLLVEHEAAGYRAFFPPGWQPRATRQGLVLLKTPGARRLLAAVVDAPGNGVREVADRAEIAPSTASYHAARLEEAGLLTKVRREGKHALSPTALGARALSLADPS